MKNEECRMRNGENPDPGIRDKGLGCRGLRLLGRYREIGRILASEGEVTARQEPRPTGWAAVGRLGGGGPLPVQISHSENFDIPHGQKDLARCLS